MSVSDWHGAPPPPRVFGLMFTLIGHTGIGTEPLAGKDLSLIIRHCIPRNYPRVVFAGASQADSPPNGLFARLYCIGNP